MVYQASLRLFKALPVDNVGSTLIDIPTALATIPKGFILAPNITRNYVISDVIRWVNELYGRDGVELNQGFHKSFGKVRDTPAAALWAQQALHYLTTYGAETAAFFNSDAVYVPRELLQVPELSSVRLTVIRAVTWQGLHDLLIAFLSTGVALSPESISDALEIAKRIGLTQDEVDAVKNREVQAGLYDQLKLVPTDPERFLRFLVYKATGQTQIVKNERLFAELKGRDNTDLVPYFDQYDSQVGFHHLSSVFNRYKPVFLSLRTNVALKKTVNRIRRLSVENHAPMREDYLNSVTNQVRAKALNPVEFQNALAKASVFRKARLAYALKYRAGNHDSILYRVRNGKSFATSYTSLRDERTWSQAALDIVLQSIAEGLAPKVQGKTFLIPEGVEYALPSTEKQFTGNIPSGSSVEVQGDLVVGVHWWDVDGGRIDLDLSMTNASGKYGWDASHRGQDVYYSGDQTSAPLPNGASEVFHVGADSRGSWLLNLNYYNHYDGHGPVPFKVVVGSDERGNIGRNYLIDPNKVVALSPSVIEDNQKTIGLVISDDKSRRFFFAETGFGSGMSARQSVASEQARKFLLGSFTDSISLNDLLNLAGANVVDDLIQVDEGVEYTDLSLEALDKSTILSLLA